ADAGRTAARVPARLAARAGPATPGRLGDTARLVEWDATTEESRGELAADGAGRTRAAAAVPRESTPGRGVGGGRRRRGRNRRARSRGRQVAGRESSRLTEADVPLPASATRFPLLLALVDRRSAIMPASAAGTGVRVRRAEDLEHDGDEGRA